MAKHTPNRRNDRTDKPGKTPDVAPAPPAESVKDSAIDARLAIPLDKDGRVLVGNMRESSRDKLKELLSNQALAKELGIAPGASAADTAIPKELMYPLISGLSIFETLIVAKATRAPREIVERIVPYSREEAQLLAPALANVLNKYSGTFLTKYGEEAALAALLVSMTINKVALVREEMDRNKPRGVVIPITPATPDAPASPATEEPNS